MFSKKQHDFIKNVTLYFLPIVVVLLWLAYIREYDSKIFYMQGAILVLILTFNILLKIDSKLYLGDGIMFVDDSDPNKLICRMELDSNLDDICNKETLTFIVKKAILD